MSNYVDTDPSRNSRRRIFILSILLILLTALISGLVISEMLFHRSGSGDVQAPPISTADAIRSICSVTLYPQSCFSALISAGSSDPEKLFHYSLTAAIDALEFISNFPGSYAKKSGGGLARKALGVCEDLLVDAARALNDTVSATRQASVSDSIDDLRTWLSAVITNLGTCLGALEEAGAGFTGEIELLMRNSTELASNSLAIVSKLLGLVGDLTGPFHRRLLADEFPAWLAEEDRRILRETAPKPNITVAKDGSGKYKTLADAVKNIPKKRSAGLFVIYVKGGTYNNENAVLNDDNVMIYGDTNGTTPTVITGNGNMVDGTPTFKTAPFRAMGKGFYGRDLVFRNTAGPNKNQAAAMVSLSDKSVCYRCVFEGYQDTLYVHSYRQFYRDCSIAGTIDFIFGNAAVVFQGCTIMPRQPAQPYQYNTITAQAKSEKNQNTGISIQGSVLKPFDDEKLTTQTYLGRPWGSFSTTVIMKTEIDKCVNRTGWIPWENDPPQETIFYGEYQNTGLGANTSNRVKWRGVYSILSKSAASKFTVESFLDGGKWLPSWVPFNLTL